MKNIFYKYLLSPFMRKTSSHQKLSSFNTLPCYLISGFKNSGKTTFITNSDLHLVDKKTIKKNKILKKHTLDHFYFTNKSVIIEDDIDTNVSQKNTRNFLKYLKRICLKKTLFGIILVINIKELVHGSPNQENNKIRQLRLYLLNIQKRFSASIPIYLIFNKCDYLNGFREFFDELSREERWQIWGIPLSTSAQNLQIKFTNEFAKITQRLSDQLIWRLQHTQDPNKRALINDFPQQMTQLQPHILTMLNELFEPKHINQLKGIFFTSSDQQLSVSSSSFPSTIFNQLPNNTLQKKSISFFTHDLLDKLIFNNFILAHPRRKTHAARSFLKYSLVTLLISGAIGLSTFWIINFKNQMMDINTASQAIAASKALAQIEGLTTLPSLEVRLKVLNNLHDAIQSLSSSHSSNLITHKLSIYKASNTLKQNTISAYSRASNAFLLPTLANHLARIISLQSSSNIEVYRALESYLMLGDNKHYDANFILNTVQIALGNAYSDEVKTALINNIRIFLASYKGNFKTDPKIISLARSRLNQLSQKQLAYIMLISNTPNEQKLSLNLNTNKNAAFLLTFVNQDVTIDSMYTANSFSAIFPHIFDKSAEEAVTGNWILGMNNHNTFSKKAVRQLSNTLLQEYLQHYIETWTGFIDNIKIVNYTDLSQLNQAIYLLSQQNSPLVQLVRLAQDNIIMPVAHLDARLNAIKQIPIDQNSGLSLLNLTNAFNQLHQFISPIFNHQTIDENIFNLTRYRMRNMGNHDAIENLLQIAPLYPEPMRSWIYNITMNTWQLMLDQTQSYINRRWQQQIVGQYKAQIANRYPFSITSNQDVSLQDFTYFFASDGLIDHFFQKYLNAFIDTSKKPWALKNLDGLTINVSQTTLTSLQTAHEIEHNFFSESAHHLHLKFHLAPVMMASDLSKFSFVLGGQSFTYQNKTTNQDHIFTWPDDSNTKVLKVVFFDKNNKQTTAEHSGQWALLRLFVDGKIEPSKKNNYDIISLTHNKLTMQSSIRFIGQKNPFSLDLFRNFVIENEL